jgi:hypothetical protein
MLVVKGGEGCLEFAREAQSGWKGSVGEVGIEDLHSESEESKSYPGFSGRLEMLRTRALPLRNSISG